MNALTGMGNFVGYNPCKGDKTSVMYLNETKGRLAQQRRSAILGDNELFH